jgi:hypothetical protein
MSEHFGGTTYHSNVRIQAYEKAMAALSERVITADTVEREFINSYEGPVIAGQLTNNG